MLALLPLVCVTFHADAFLRLRGGAAMPRGVEKQLMADDVDGVQRALSENKLTKDSLSKEGNTALHVCSRHGAVRCLELLVSAAINPIDARRESDGGTPLMYASQNGHPACVEALLAYGAEVNAQQAEGSAALHYASRHGHDECLSLLLAADGCDADLARTTDGVTPLMVAANFGNAECLEQLVRAKADPARRSAARLSAMDLACRHGHAAVVRALLRAKAPFEESVQELGGTCPLHVAAAGGHVACVRELCAAGAQPGKARVDGSTPLHYAAVSGHAEVVRLLCASGASASARRADLATALHLAAQGGHTPCVELLLANGADVNAAVPMSGLVDRSTALDLAQQAGHKQVAAMLRQAGALLGVQVADAERRGAAASGHS